MNNSLNFQMSISTIQCSIALATSCSIFQLANFGCKSCKTCACLKMCLRSRGATGTCNDRKHEKLVHDEKCVEVIMQKGGANGSKCDKGEQESRLWGIEESKMLMIFACLWPNPHMMDLISKDRVWFVDLWSGRMFFLTRTCTPKIIVCPLLGCDS